MLICVEARILQRGEGEAYRSVNHQHLYRK